MATKEDIEDLSSMQILKNADTFTMWDFEIKILFRAKQLMNIVDGTELLADEEQNEENIKKWKTRDAIAQYYIVKTVDKQVKTHILTCNTAKEMYDTLKSIYKKETSQQKCLLLQEFYNYKFQKNIDIMGNVSHIQNIAFKLNRLDQKIDDTMIITKIMTILPEEYKHFSSAWDSTIEKEKTLENLKARLTSEEEKFKASIKEDESTAFNVMTAREKGTAKCFNCHEKGHVQNKCPLKRKCGICKRTNHLEKDCYFKNREDRRKQCSICKRTNHSERDCYFGDKKRGKIKSTEKISFFTEADRDEVKQFEYTYNSFVIDSGCSSHMVKDLKMLRNTEECNTVINVAKKGETLTALAVGHYESSKCNLKDVSYVPNLTRNLLSVNAVTENEGIVVFLKNKVEIIKNNTVVLEGNKTENGLYVISLKPEDEALVTHEVDTNTIWHRKLGHISFGNLKKIPDVCDGVPSSVNKCQVDSKCVTCIEAKQVRQPFGKERQRATGPLQIIHSDVCGPIDPPTHDKKNYFLTCIDDYTHFCKVYLLTYKSEVETFLKQYVHEAEAHFNLKVSKLRCDNGGEYTSDSFKMWCKNRGIVLDYTILYSPQLNGTAERCNRTLMNKARAMMFDSQLDKEMWGEAILTSAYLQNRSPTVATDVTPAEKWFNKRPNLSRLKIFGSVAYAKVLRQLKKLGCRSKKCIFVGYSMNRYRL